MARLKASAELQGFSFELLYKHEEKENEEKLKTQAKISEIRGIEHS